MSDIVRVKPRILMILERDAGHHSPRHYGGGGIKVSTYHLQRLFKCSFVVVLCVTERGVNKKPSLPGLKTIGKQELYFRGVFFK